MKVIERRVLRGPNIYSVQPDYLAAINLPINLKTLNDVTSTAIPGFNESLRGRGMGG